MDNLIELNRATEERVGEQTIGQDSTQGSPLAFATKFPISSTTGLLTLLVLLFFPPFDALILAAADEANKEKYKCHKKGKQ